MTPHPAQQHLSKDDLTSVYYGELDAGAHLESCSPCRDELARLSQLLDSLSILPDPAPASGFEDRIWTRLEPTLAHQPVPAIRKPWLRPFVLPASIAAMLVIAFQLGRYMPAVSPQPSAVAQGDVATGRVLASELRDHLERSRMILVELVNSPDQPRLDIAQERRIAGELVKSNRLYRQTAATVGGAGLEETLDDLERVLLEISHSPDTVPPESVEALRNRVESLQLLFRVRVLESEIKSRREAAPLTESSL